MAVERVLNTNYNYSSDKADNADPQCFSEKPEEVVWNEFLNGSENALTFIYRQYAHQLYNYAKQFTQDEELVQDCIQDLFYQLIKSRHKLGRTTSIRFYLYSSLRRLLKRKVNKIKKIDTTTLATDGSQFKISLSSEKMNPIDPFKNEQRQLMEKAVNALPERQREALLLLYFEGLSYQEMAEIMNIDNIKYARTLVYRAIESMRYLLDGWKEDLISIAFIILFWFVV